MCSLYNEAEIIKHARKMIRREKPRRVEHKQRYTTEDIVTSVSNAHRSPTHASDLYSWAQKCWKPIYEAHGPECLAISVHRWVRRNLTYKEDPNGTQDVFAPAPAFWHTQEGGEVDCKSITTFTNAIFRSLGLAVECRFVGYGKEKKSDTDSAAGIGHVYAVLHDNGREYICDAVWPEPLTEKKYNPKIKRRYLMYPENSGLNRIEGIGNPGRGRLVIPNIETETDGLLQARLFIQNREIMSEIINETMAKNGRVSGIGSASLKSVEAEIEIAQQMLRMAEQNDVAGIYGLEESIGRASKQQRKTKRKAAVQKLTEAIKKPVQAVRNAVDNVKQGIAKKILEVMLPAFAPFFLLLFVGPDLEPRLTDRARRKKKKAEAVARFMTRAMGISSESFMLIVRNGILKAYRKSPETVLRDGIRGRKAIRGSEIGVIPPQVITIGVNIIKFLVEHFRKKKEADEETEISADDSVNFEQDFGDMGDAEANQFAAAVAQQDNSFNEAVSSDGQIYDNAAVDQRAVDQANEFPRPLQKTGWC
jgi:hypothetical protein